MIHCGLFLSLLLALAACLVALAGCGEAPLASGVRGRWPSYLGPNGNFSEDSGARLIDDMTQARLVWISEEKRIGYGKQPEGIYPRILDDCGDLPPGGVTTPILAGGLLLHAYFVPSGAVWDEQIEKAVGPAFVRDRWRIAADDVVIAIDAATGKTRWKKVFPDKGLNVPSIKYGGWGITPCAADSKVFVLGTTGRMYGLALADGKLLWETNVGPRHQALEELKAQCVARRRLCEARGRRLDMLGGLLVAEGVLIAPDLALGLVGIDIAHGRELWRIAGPVTSGMNMPCPARLGDRTFLAAINREGDLRLIDPRTGQVLRTKPLKCQHLTQPVAADGRLLIFEPHPTFRGEDPKDAGPLRRYGALAAYRFDEQGARREWVLPPEYIHELHMDGGPARRVIPRDGLVYYMNWTNRPERTRRLVVIRLSDGTVLQSVACDKAHLYLWGDRLVLPNDIQHRPQRHRPEVWQMHTCDPFDFRPLGGLWQVNTPDHRAYVPTGGYEVPVLEVFAAGMMFCRTMGGFRCYDLRSPR